MRLLTRSDFDGLASAVLLVEKGIVDSYRFVHPKDVQDGKIPVSMTDVLANVPFAPGCGLWFDHHTSEEERLRVATAIDGAVYPAASTAQIIWDYYGGDKTFKKHLLPMLAAVNKSDAGQFTREEILKPTGWVLLSFIMDPRTGLGRFGDYRISNLQLMEDMIQYCRKMSVEEIFEVIDVKERVNRYFEQTELFKDMIRKHSKVERNLIITDLRTCDVIYTGNRFLIYALHPEQNIEVRVMWGRERQNVVISCGHSILNRTSRTNVGSLMLRYGGGGHPRVGTCQVPANEAKAVIRDICEQIHADG